MKKNIVIGFLGTVLDAGKSAQRWERWRPTVNLCQHEDWLIDEFELLYTPGNESLLNFVIADIKVVSPSTKVIPQCLDLDDPWDFELVYSCLYDYAKTKNFSHDQANYWVHITTGTHVAQICLFLLTEAHYFPAKLLQTSPPKKSLGLNVPCTITTIDLDLSKYDLLATRFAQEKAQDVAHLKSGIATRNAVFNHMIDELEQVSVRSTAPILLMGATGAGKSFLAKRIYELKKYRQQIMGDFIDVNCATLRGDAAMSALFGHVKGAFTGAATARVGYLKSADKGILFLDEIGELGLEEQTMLLKALEDKCFFPVGSDKTTHSDFQLIAGTCRDLSVEIEAGRFREDLFARINLWTYTLPSLKHRPEDIEPNIDFELERLSAQQNRALRFNKEAKAMYLSYATSSKAQWRGNFRELSASINRLSTFADEGRITENLVIREIERLNSQYSNLQSSETQNLLANHSIDLSIYISDVVLNTVDLFDYAQLQTVIAVCLQSKNLSIAGRTLFAASRTQKTSKNDADRVRKYLAKFELTFESIKQVYMKESHHG